MTYNEIKRVAETKKFTIKDLATALGLSSNGLKRSIEGETISMKTIKNLCSLLNITIAEFFGETGGDEGFMAAERVPYGAPLAMKGTESSTIDALVRHVAWLEEEVDRLRNENAKRGK